jgi:hypothetical protein
MLDSGVWKMEESLEEWVMSSRGGGLPGPFDVGDWMRTERLVMGDLTEREETLAWKM